MSGDGRFGLDGFVSELKVRMRESASGIGAVLVLLAKVGPPAPRWRRMVRCYLVWMTVRSNPLADLCGRQHRNAGCISCSAALIYNFGRSRATTLREGECSIVTWRSHRNCESRPGRWRIFGSWSISPVIVVSLHNNNSSSSQRAAQPAFIGNVFHCPPLSSHHNPQR